MKISEKKLWIQGAVLIAATVFLNMLPGMLPVNNSFWMFGLILDAPVLYYIIAAALAFPYGTVLSAVLGNKVTGFLTFAFTSVICVLTGSLTPVFVSFAAAFVIALLYYGCRLNRWIKIIICSIAVALVNAGAQLLFGDIDMGGSEVLIEALTCAAICVLLLIISSFLEQTALFAEFDKERRRLDRNYRVRSINLKLMLVINIICIVLIVSFSALYLVLLSQKEAEKKASRDSVWGVVLYNAISEDADIYAEHDTDRIKAEAEPIRQALEQGYIETPAYVLVTTNIGGKYFMQCYEVNLSDTGSLNYYDVEWINEVVKEDTGDMIFKLDEGTSRLSVSEKSTVKESIAVSTEKILVLALVLMVLINILADAVIRRNIVIPINRMTTEALDFAFKRDDENNPLSGEVPSHSNAARVEITSGDEIESLSRAFHKTMDDVSEYVDEVREKSRQVSDMQHNIILTMADIIESRDVNTGGHIKRTAVYVGIIARKLMRDGLFTDVLTEDYLNDMIVAAPLHDMGKIHVPDTILNKEGKLTDTEFAIMKSHAAVGKELLDLASDSLGEFSYLIIAKQMAESHHEWWNGNGYPDKIGQDDIPLCARIMAVADVFDALVSKRCYKEPMELDVAFGIIEKETGTHFDPVIGRAFLDCRAEIENALAELSK